MYPLKFFPIYFNKIWGGRDIESIKKDAPEGNIGESWELSCHPNGESIISNGKYKGIKLKELIKENKKNIIGKDISEDKFPILIKFITANDNLSIQVHPDDVYAENFENDNGKSEAWYILKVKNDGKIITGLNNVEKHDIKEKIVNGKLENHLNYTQPKENELYYIEAGLIHGIGKGITLLEIQESSDLTYRVYDYNRGRELHINKATKVINEKLKCEKIIPKKKIIKNNICYEFGDFKSFSIKRYDINKNLLKASNKDGFNVYICVSGKGVITYMEGTETINLGELVMIPSSLGEYCIIGNLGLIEVSV
ncbi:type I phosphomannose isomerase catalytic subunit [Clostridium senegalense]|uniref:type I phosphomannose isomerase catalytic subunit n=1 Tax=Clostridium senegalense TaxID=1465809 RepID=UPI001C122701|nr:type I phosphomannose isomerase catalytic subunit [Clostridium senegalense]MBU5226458.1 mannose-6-phosphate isomerase [Clostridium senegalense]